MLADNTYIDHRGESTWDRPVGEGEGGLSSVVVLHLATLKVDEMMRYPSASRISERMREETERSCI